MITTHTNNSNRTNNHSSSNTNAKMLRRPARAAGRPRRGWREAPGSMGCNIIGGYLIYIYIYVHTYIHVYIHMHIYVERERDRGRYVYIYI